MARNKYPEETIKLILDTAAQLFLEKGYEKTSLQDIINATHLSKGAIYHHFASKEDIFIQICNRFGQQNAAVLGGIRDDQTLSGCDKLKKVFRVALDSHYNHSVMHMKPYLLDNPRFLALQIKDIYAESAPHYIQPILEQGIADGSIQAEHPKELAEAIMMLSNIWINPLLLPADSEQVAARCTVFMQLTQALGLDLFDEDMIEAYRRYNDVLNQSQ